MAKQEIKYSRVFVILISPWQRLITTWLLSSRTRLLCAGPAHSYRLDETADWAVRRRRERWNVGYHRSPGTRADRTLPRSHVWLSPAPPSLITVTPRPARQHPHRVGSNKCSIIDQYGELGGGIFLQSVAPPYQYSELVQRSLSVKWLPYSVPL